MCMDVYGSFRKLGAPYFGVLMILLFRVLNWGPLFTETPICMYVSAYVWNARTPTTEPKALITSNIRYP